MKNTSNNQSTNNNPTKQQQQDPQQKNAQKLQDLHNRMQNAQFELQQAESIQIQQCYGQSRMPLGVTLMINQKLAKIMSATKKCEELLNEIKLLEVEMKHGSVVSSFKETEFSSSQAAGWAAAMVIAEGTVKTTVKSNIQKSVDVLCKMGGAIVSAEIPMATAAKVPAAAPLPTATLFAPK